MERHDKIQSFKPEAYWVIQVQVSGLTGQELLALLLKLLNVHAYIYKVMGIEEISGAECMDKEINKCYM